ncbi:hypothetical protein BBJ29_002465 [Phytophthora kernoviae]|uniref:Dipeptidase n=1 Tax=Phytophthora kernoviae TaxID=325452 RepID=A0A3R7GGX6_9STRA|nr:hypothetical protein BBJ29_002465 [Phytophthora kernoviae]
MLGAILQAALLLTLAASPSLTQAEDRCTAIIVGAKASTTGTPMTTHTNDCSSCDFRIAKVPAMTHKDGDQYDVVLAAFNYPRYVGEARGEVYLLKNVDTRFYNWTTSPTIGSIPEVAQTFAYIEGAYGIINEHQVAIGESTCAARFVSKPVTQGGDALFDVTELSRIALQRATTAREAIQIMGDLAVQYGYYGAEWEGDGVFDEAGEALTVTDTKEAWIFHILPDDTGKSAVWAAQRVPDDQISGVANQFVIRELDLNNPSEFLASPNIHDVAIRNNIWKPDEGTPFDFTRAYAQPRADTHQYYSTRRIWRLFTLANPELKLSPETDVLASDYPFSVKPVSPLSPRDIMRFQRDHYEGTPFDMTKGPKSGPYGNPDRYDASPNGDLSKDDINRGHFERAISIFRASYSFVSIVDPFNPDNAFLWFGQYAPHATTYTPVFVQVTDVPEQLSRGSLYAFDRESSFWIHALVGNWAARFYSYTSPFVGKVQDEVESYADGMLRSVLIQAAQLKKQDGVPAMVEFLTQQSETFAKRAHSASLDLFDYLVTAFHDGYQVSNFYAKMLTVQSIFYPKWWLQEVGFFDGAEEIGDAEPITSKVAPATAEPASSNSGMVAKARAGIAHVAHKGSVSYFTTTILVILAGLAGLFLGRKFHGPLTNKKQGYRPLQ